MKACLQGIVCYVTFLKSFREERSCPADFEGRVHCVKEGNRHNLMPRRSLTRDQYDRYKKSRYQSACLETFNRSDASDALQAWLFTRASSEKRS